MDLQLRLHSLPPTCIHSFLFAALAFASLRYAFDTVEGYQRILDSLGLENRWDFPLTAQVFLEMTTFLKLGLALFLILGPTLAFCLG